VKRIEMFIGKSAYQVTEGQLRDLQNSVAEQFSGSDRDLLDACISHICTGRANGWFRPGVLGSPEWEHIDDKDYVVRDEISKRTLDMVDSSAKNVQEGVASDPIIIPEED